MFELISHLQGLEYVSSLLSEAIQGVVIALIDVLAAHLNILILSAFRPFRELLERLGGHGAIEQHELAVLQVDLLVVFLDDDLCGVAPALQGLDSVMEVHEDRRLDACLVDLLHEVEGLLELLLDCLGQGVAEGCLLREVEGLSINFCFEVPQLFELLPEVLQVGDVDDELGASDPELSQD